MSSPITERLRSKPISMPLMADPISVTAMMPMITPSAVRIERILCARIWLNAIRKLSVSSMVMSLMDRLAAYVFVFSISTLAPSFSLRLMTV